MEPNWISVSTALPEAGKVVVVYVPDEMRFYRRQFAALDAEGVWREDFADSPLYADVTHWMPLEPFPPDVEDEAEAPFARALKGSP